MKVEVEIPEGKYCGHCIFKVYDICRLLKKRQRVGDKHPDCPSLKKEDQRLEDQKEWAKTMESGHEEIQ